MKKENSDILVSVKMITYNHEAFIAKAIEGVINQKTSFNYNLVIGEDCSTDNTREIVLQYAKKYPQKIKVITSESNVGITINSQRTHEACEGKYMAYCEGDDWWIDNEKLEKQVKFLENNPDYGMVHTDAHFRNTQTDELNTNYLKSNFDTSHYQTFISLQDQYEKILSKKTEIITATVTARKKLIEKARKENIISFSNRFIAKDAPTWLELSRMSKIHFLPEATAIRNELQESASRSNNKERYYDYIFTLVDSKIHYINKYPISKQTYESIFSTYLSKWATNILRFSYRNDNFERAKKLKSIYLKRFNLKQQLLYLACKFPFIHKNWIFKNFIKD